MKVTSFAVRGFKNFSRELRLDGLSDINVIHGQNSVGKSNLLQAIGLMFLLLSRPDESEPESVGLIALALNDTDIFTAGGEGKIHIASELTLDHPLERETQLLVEVELIKQRGRPVVRAFSVKGEKSGMHLRSKLAERINKEALGATDRAFALIGTERDPETAMVRRSNLQTSTLANELYDAQQSPDLALVKRWRAFQSAMRNFSSITGKGEFVAVLPRGEDNARLLFESETARTPLRAMGTGVRQLTALFGRILMTQASIVAIEEPELNLRSAVQKQVSETLAAIPRDPDSGIDQLFIASHSSDFERGPEFWYMEPGAEGPVIRRRPIADAALVTGARASTALPDTAIPHWVSSQGIMEVPKRVRERLGVEHGGTVMFIDHPRGAILCNEKQGLEEMLGPEIAEAASDVE